MAKRGRPSAASLNVVPLGVTPSRPKLNAPALLTKTERALFAETVAHNPHLRTADGPLLAAYAQSLAKTYRMSSVRRQMPAPPVDATQALNLSAGVSYFKVSRGRSLSCRAALFS